MPRMSALPPTLAPRLVGREAAAAYAGISATSFDALVQSSIMPKPKTLIGRRKVWDVRELDAAIDDLPHHGETSADDGSWSDVDAP